MEYAKQEAEAKQKFLEEWRKSGKAKVAGGGLTLSSLFGGQAPVSFSAPLCLFVYHLLHFFRLPYWPAVSQASHSPEPLTYLEQKRSEAQHQYLEEQKYIQDNKAHFDKLLEEDRQAAAAQMSGNLLSVLGSLTGAPPPPPPQAQSQGGSGDVVVPVQDGPSSKVSSPSPSSPK